MAATFRIKRAKSGFSSFLDFERTMKPLEKLIKDQGYKWYEGSYESEMERRYFCKKIDDGIIVLALLIGIPMYFSSSYWYVHIRTTNETKKEKDFALIIKKAKAYLKQLGMEEIEI